MNIEAIPAPFPLTDGVMCWSYSIHGRVPCMKTIKWNLARVAARVRLEADGWANTLHSRSNFNNSRQAATPLPPFRYHMRPEKEPLSSSVAPWK